VSWSISLTVKDGTVTVASTGGTLPEGSVSVSGHQDETYDSLNVSVGRIKA
jgi:hypothetical protein